MDSIRTEMGGFISLEETMLLQHDAAFQSDMRRMFSADRRHQPILAALCPGNCLVALPGDTAALQVLRSAGLQNLLEHQEAMNTQLQKANFSLRESEENLSVTLTSIGDGVIATDAQARVTRLNPIAEVLTGWTQDEAFGRPVDEIFHIINQETRELATIPVIATLAHGTVQGLANHTGDRPQRKRMRHCRWCAPIRDRSAEVIGAVLVFRNVTEEHAVQLALRDSAALVQTILNTVVDGIVTLHARGGIVETVNPAAERMFGYSAAELKGKDFSLLIPELDQDLPNGSLEYYNRE